MKRYAYREQDVAFGQVMLTLRTAMNMMQTDIADYLGVSRRTIGAWEAGSKYPKHEHLQKFITLAVQRRAFPAGREAEEIRALWQATRQRTLLDEAWLASVLNAPQAAASSAAQPASPQPVINVPFQPTPFIGRVAELGDIARVLNDPNCRLLTLLGPGGVGKTRLSIAAMQAQGGAYRDGATFVPLASVNTPGQIVSVMGDVLGLSFSGQFDPTKELVDYLRGLHMLLVMDNFEHVLDGADLVNTIIQQAPHITILTTSRERLNLQVEWVFDVEGLAYPLGDSLSNLPSVAELATYSAIQLFVQRVIQVQSGLPPHESTYIVMARICQHVAGMPLAIELAAAGVRMLSLDEIEGKIHSNLDILATSLRDVPSRHRSMRAVFDHSWNLLTEPERILFSRLAVFRGGCTLAAAEWVAGATRFGLTALIDKSLLRQVNSPGSEVGGTEPRLSLLEPSREYALEKLRAANELGRLQAAHAAYYLGMAETAMANWENPEVEPPIDQLNIDLNNIRAALQWAIEGGHATLGLQLAGILWRFWRSGGYTSEGREWLDAVLALDEPNQDDATLNARLLATHAAAWLASDQHDYTRASQLFEQSVALRRALGTTEADTHMLHNQALHARAVGQYGQATALLEEALERNRALSGGGLGRSLYELGFSLYGLALMLREQGDFAGSAELLKEHMQFHQDIGDRESMAQSLLAMSDIARDQGDPAQTAHYTNQSLEVYREFGTQWAIGFALNNLAQAAYVEKNYAKALELINESIGVFRATQNNGGLAEVLVTHGVILAAQGDIDGAQTALTEALRLAWMIGPRLLVITAAENLASLMVQTGQSALAVRLLGAASASREQMGTPLRPADQPGIDHTMSTLQSSINPNVFASIWADAKGQSIEQALLTIPGMESVFESPTPINEQT